MIGFVLLTSAHAQESRPSVFRTPQEAAVDAKLRAPFTLHGKVVDFDGNPVEGANVIVSQEKWYVDKSVTRFKKHLKTSVSGEFDLDGESMTRLYIEIDKPGYEYRANDNPSFFHKPRDIWPDPNRREIYRLRKREAPAYVDSFQLGWGIDSYAFDKTYRLDLFRARGSGTTLEPGREEFPKRYNTDLEFRMRPAEEKDWYIITIRAVKENSGIQRIDKEFFKAPDTGYQKEIDVKIKIERENPDPIYICAKTGQPARYARLDLTLVGDPDRLTVRIKGLTNPFGEQSLEYDQELSQFPEVRTILRETVQAADYEGKVPVRLDIKKMKDEARAKRKEKELQRQQATSAPAGAATTATAPAK